MRDDPEFVRAAGLKLFVHRFREEGVPPSGLTVLLIHGFVDSGATWDRVAEPIARAGHLVLAPDLRGFGQSDRVGAGGYYHFPDYVADVAALVEALAPARLAVVGHSMGGTIAALYAGTEPARVERLALIEGIGPLAMEPALSVDRMGAWLRDLRNLERWSRPLASLDDAIARLGRTHPRVPRESIARVTGQLTRADAEGRLFWAFDPLHRTTSPSLFQIAAFRVFLERIACPTLFVSGGPAGWHPPDEAERVAWIRDVRTVAIDGGHMLHWSEPDRLGSALASFLAEGGTAR